MKTIKVFIASSEELKLERLEFVDMIQQLNDILEPRAIQIKPVKWEYLDASMSAERKQSEYNKALGQCELCLVLYWTKFGEYTEEEFNTAFENLKAGENPRKLYIYFKETPGEITPELKNFKGSFATKYGHFYCKFENTDTMRLHFLLQFEQYQSTLPSKEDFVKVKDSKVEFCGHKVEDLNLENVPFVGKNPYYQRLKEDLQKTQQEIITFETILVATPNEAIESLLLQKRFDRERLAKQVEEIEKSLMDTAKQIVSLSYTASNARLQRAIELFEQGDNKGANAVLNFNEIKADMEQNAHHFDQAQKLMQDALDALRSNLEECKLKVKTLQTEKTDGWFKQCQDIYDEAIKTAKDRIPEKDFADLLLDYALFLYNQKQYHLIQDKYCEALSIYRKLSEAEPDKFLPDVAMALNNLAILHYKTNRNKEAEAEYDEALEIRHDLAKKNPAAYLPDMAATLNNLACLHCDNNRYEEAETEYGEALEIRRDLAKTNPDAYLPNVAMTLNNLASLHNDNNRHEEAEAEFKKSLEIYRSLSEIDTAYLSCVAECFNMLSYCYWNQGKCKEAQQTIEEAISIEPSNPEWFDSKGEFLFKMDRMDEALQIYHRILELDAEFFNHTESELHKGLKEKGLIDD